jgi:hypothetical protein
MCLGSRGIDAFNQRRGFLSLFRVITKHHQVSLSSYGLLGRPTLAI